ncbi:unnamed protein product [Cylindrotheca closterium]|uniref:UBP-type domain-containing protein n=1 Tax=Cylindrotheca closterium TaxID=2856 RepID=A0AAD2PUH8_9STRA|nr:unnamed protein product [Cylindrotheca closterium]
MPELSLKVTIDNGGEDEQQTEESLNRISHDFKPSDSLPSSDEKNDDEGNDHSMDCFVAIASAVELSINPQVTASSSIAAVFVPPSLVDNLLQIYTTTTATRNPHNGGSCYWIPDEHTRQIAEALLPSVHSSLISARIRGIILHSTKFDHINAPSSILLLEIMDITMTDVLEIANGESMASNKTAVLKILPIASIQFTSKSNPIEGVEEEKLAEPENQALLIPSCPVCLHRIDANRLGLPRPRIEQLCSSYCSLPDFDSANSQYKPNCHRQAYLDPWPLPAKCKVCLVIQNYWFQNGYHHRHDESNDLFCGGCGMHKTLWVCLTCSFVGCGRYTNKHSVDHFQKTNHPFALELATLRIWDYTHGEYGGFVHRVDLLDCPSSPILCHPWISRPQGFDAHASAAAASQQQRGHVEVEKMPKKATIIGEEYEVLLQSALEDQAQFYEGEITRLRAEFTGENIDMSTLSKEEQRQIEELKAEIKKLRGSIDSMGQDYVQSKEQEASQRNASQRLLREQQEAKEMLKEIEKEAKEEAEKGKFQVEDLEQQVSDLTANLRMMQQFSRSAELQEAQIFGTTTATAPNNASKRRGKKKGRNSRR